MGLLKSRLVLTLEITRLGSALLTTFVSSSRPKQRHRRMSHREGESYCHFKHRSSYLIIPVNSIATLLPAPGPPNPLRGSLFSLAAQNFLSICHHLVEVQSWEVALPY